MPINFSEETESFTGILKRQTEQAILLDYDGDIFWLPKSQIELEEAGTDDDGNTLVDVEIPVWLAEKKELI